MRINRKVSLGGLFFFFFFSLLQWGETFVSCGRGKEKHFSLGK